MLLREARLRMMVLAVLVCLAPAGLFAADKNETWIEVRTPHFVVVSNASEKQARRVADQFEQIRAIFHTAFAKLRVDPGQRILILAAKNEKSLKELLPAYWEVKGHVHPAGIYVAGPEKHYVALRLDTSGENPYHTVYHEYTHALVGLNFRGLPVWLNEGLAEFYGNTILGDKEVRLGHFDAGHLMLLQRSKLIPIETLLQVDHSSPFYNEENRASVFYAESWALTHYLMLDPDARKQQLMSLFLDAFQKSDNQVEAAQRTFGDLKEFGRKIEGYARQQSFYAMRMKAPAEVAAKDYVARTLPDAESLALRGDFHLHMNRTNEARAMLEQAVELDPKLAAAHESLGYFYFRQNDLELASKEFAEAVNLDSRNYLAHYYHALLGLQGRITDPEELEEVKAGLEKTIQLNPKFAPAYAALSSFYLFRPETKQKALDAAFRAAQLAPGELQYGLNLGQVLLRLNREAEARSLAKRMQAAAKTPAEVSMAQSLQIQIEQHQQLADLKRAEPEEEEREEPGVKAIHREEAPGANQAANAEKPEERPGDKERNAREAAVAGAIALSTRPGYSMMGRIAELDCSPAPEVSLTLTMSTITMRLHSADIAKLDYRVGEGSSTAGANPCPKWKGRRAQISYTLTPGKAYDGEITAIYFF